MSQPQQQQQQQQVKLNLRPEILQEEETLRSFRRYLHQYPETKFNEFRTAEFIAKELNTYGLDEVITSVGKTGVVGILRGKSNHPCIALRADMDGLPVHETNTDKEYCSKIPGVMHACGHDGHMSILLVVAKILAKQKEKLNGSIKFVFQPAEEGGGGAKYMIEDGLLSEKTGGLEIDEIYGLHLWNTQDLGTVGVQAGPVMANSDRFVIEVKGKGGHASMPHDTVDSIVVAAHLITTLQTIVSRNVNPLDSAVVTIGSLHSGAAYNVIPEIVNIEGTVRSYKDEIRELVVKRMEEICKGVGATFGATIKFSFFLGYPAVINWEENTKKVAEAAKKVVGDQGVTPPALSLGGEDFAFYLKQKPGCFFFVGSSPSPQPTSHPHHCPNFDIREEALSIGGSVFLELIDQLLIK